MLHRKNQTIAPVSVLALPVVFVTAGNPFTGAKSGPQPAPYTVEVVGHFNNILN